MRRRVAGVAVLASALILAGILAPPARAATEHQLLGEAYAQAFTLRATIDYGGSTPLPFYFGSYADAFLSTPPASADGQASWYNLGIAETALFTPPGACTPEEQQARVQQGIEDTASWVTDQAVPALMQGTIPVAPIPTLPCSERFPGFSQSRYPATETIAEHASDDLLVSSLCRQAAACGGAEQLQQITGGVLQGGSFVATATRAPSQTSDAFVAGVGLAPLLTIGSARAQASTALTAAGVVSQSAWTLANLCVLPGPGGCALHIDAIRQIARVTRAASGAVKEREARTVLAGVGGGGQDSEIAAADLAAGLPPIDVGGRLQIQAVSTTGGCGDPASPQVADAGGLLITGKGGSTGVSLPVPLLGTANGGGLLLGGACATGRLQTISFDIPSIPGPGTVEVPGVRIPGPPPPSLVGAPVVLPPQVSGPRVVSKSVVRYELRGAPAWRTAPWWGSVLGALILLTLVGYVFRTSRPVAPVVAAIDRFGRQFLRG